jgi:hypothetical protein
MVWAEAVQANTAAAIVPRTADFMMAPDRVKKLEIAEEQ